MVFQWGKSGKPEGFRFMMNDGSHEVPIHGGDPIFTNVHKSTARVSWPVGKGAFEIDMKEKSLIIKAKGQLSGDWFLDLYVAGNAKTAFREVTENSASYEFDGHTYKLAPKQGTIEKTDNGSLYRIRPQNRRIVLLLADL